MLTIAFSPSLFPPSLCLHLPLYVSCCLSFILYRSSPDSTVLLPLYSVPLVLPPRCPPPLPPCSMRHQVGSATLGCRATLRGSSATACLRLRGPGPSLQMSMKPCIIWTGCCTVSLLHTSMTALDVLAGCDVRKSSFIFISRFSDCDKWGDTVSSDRILQCSYS